MPRSSAPVSTNASTPRSSIRAVVAKMVEQLEQRTFLSAASFQSLQNIPLGQTPTSVATGDFNDDGAADLVVAGPDGVTLLLNDGNGLFPSPVSLSHSPTRAVVVGDFNGDYEDDIAFISDGGTLTLRAGHGDGTFAAGQTSHVASNTQALATGDFNDDGNIDLAVAGGSGASVLFGKGDGKFRPAVTLSDSADFTAIAVGDINGDYTDDVAAVGSAGVQVFTSNDDGTFASGVAVANTADASSVTLGDFNYDGFGDLALTYPSQGTVDVLMGQGDTTTGEWAAAFDSPQSIATGGTPTSLTIGYVTNDGNPSLLVTDTANDQITVLNGAGDGTFTLGDSHATDSGPIAALVGDFNEDGLTDIASVNGTGQSISLIGNVPANVSVTASAPSTIAIGTNLTYTVTVTNNGPADAQGVSLYDYLPPGATLISAESSQGSVDTSSEGSLTIAIGDLANGESATLTVIVKPTAYGAISSYLSVSSETPQTNYSATYANVETRVTGLHGAELEVTQTTGGNDNIGIAVDPVPVGVNGGIAVSNATPATSVVSGVSTGASAGGPAIDIMPIYRGWYGSAQIGKNLVYTVTIRNYGPDAATGVTLIDTLPADATFVSATSSVGTVDSSKGGTVSVALGDLASGATVTLTITVVPTKEGTINNSVAVAAADAASDPFTDNNSSSLDTSVYDPANPPIYRGPIYLADGGVAMSGAPVPNTSGVTPTGGTAAGNSPATVAASVSVTGGTVAEGNSGDSNLVFTISRTGDTTAGSTVHFATNAGTAKSGKDFLARRGKVTFRPGVSTVTVKVPVKGDNKVETDESLSLALSDPKNASIATASATGTITNDDAKVSKHRNHTSSNPFNHSIRINFAPQSASAVKGFLTDSGAVFGPRTDTLNYGWDVDNSSAAVERNLGPARKHDTFNVLGTGGASKWEIELPNGKYRVKLVAGDPAQNDSAYQVDAEGTTLLAGTPGGRHHAIGAKAIVTVTDGRLTLTPGTATADKLMFISIKPVK